MTNDLEKARNVLDNCVLRMASLAMEIADDPSVVNDLEFMQELEEARASWQRAGQKFVQTGIESAPRPVLLADALEELQGDKSPKEQADQEK